MAKHKENVKKITSIGGSALIEGIMMKGPKRATVAVRTEDGSIYTEEVWKAKPQAEGDKQKFSFKRVPFIRGFFGLIDSMKLSYKSLMISADKAVELEGHEEEMTKFERFIFDKFGDKILNALMVVAAVLGVALAVVLFFFVPTMLFDLTAKIVPAFRGDGPQVVLYKSVFEGILKIILFLVYLIICTAQKDMKRVFMYHGAEHKTIFCYESEEELTVENVKKHTRFHPRCGTSFMVIMLVVGIVIGLFIPASPFGIKMLRPVIKILLLPLTCGIGYELIKICGKHNNAFTRIIAAPGIWAQHITTKEPDDSMIEVAIEALKSVIPENGEDIIGGKPAEKSENAQNA